MNIHLTTKIVKIVFSIYWIFFNLFGIFGLCQFQCGMQNLDLGSWLLFVSLSLILITGLFIIKKFQFSWYKKWWAYPVGLFIAFYPLILYKAVISLLCGCGDF